jgi:hypothetical protein
MGFIRDFKRDFAAEYEKERAKREGRFQRRDLTPMDRLGWDDALSSREESTMPPRTREEVIERVKAINPIRWRMMRRDFKWLQKEMHKMGLNPEDARFLL